MEVCWALILILHQHLQKTGMQETKPNVQAHCKPLTHHMYYYPIGQSSHMKKPKVKMQGSTFLPWKYSEKQWIFVE